MELIKVHIFADGGHEARGSYGSFLITEDRDAQWLVKRAPLPEGTTSNEAEYLIQIWAAGHLFRMIGELPEVASQYEVRIYSDSALVVNQLTGKWKVRAANLRPLRDELLAQLLVFGKWEAEWVPRKIMVGLFGH
jgi:ribonuclease HI